MRVDSIKLNCVFVVVTISEVRKELLLSVCIRSSRPRLICCWFWPSPLVTGGGSGLLELNLIAVVLVWVNSRYDDVMMQTLALHVSVWQI